MQTQTGPRSRTQRKVPQTRQSIYPAWDYTQTQYWLAQLLRNQAELEALKAHAVQIKAVDESPLTNAIHSGIVFLADRVYEAAKYCAKDGQLPYAHQHTTVFEGAAA